MNKIELRKRTPEERAAYAEGFAAGYQRGLEPQTVILRLREWLPGRDLALLIDSLQQLNTPHGYQQIILPPVLEFCGVMPRDAEIEVVRREAQP